MHGVVCVCFLAKYKKTDKNKTRKLTKRIIAAMFLSFLHIHCVYVPFYYTACHFIYSAYRCNVYVRWKRPKSPEPKRSRGCRRQRDVFLYGNFIFFYQCDVSGFIHTNPRIFSTSCLTCVFPRKKAVLFDSLFLRPLLSEN